jgi:hypothetical protein
VKYESQLFTSKQGRQSAKTSPRDFYEIGHIFGACFHGDILLGCNLGEDLATYPTPAATIINQQRTSLCDTSESISELFYDLVHIT